MTLKDIFLAIDPHEVTECFGYPMVIGGNQVFFAKDETAFTICKALKACCKRGKFYSPTNPVEVKQRMVEQAILTSESMLKAALSPSDNEQELRRILDTILSCQCLPDDVDEKSKFNFALQTIHSLVLNYRRNCHR